MNNIIYLNQYKQQRTIYLSEDILNEYTNYYDGEIDIIDILKKMDFEIIFKKDFERFDNDDIALLSIHKYFLKQYGTDKVIYVNDYFSKNIIRYNLACLLGSYVNNYRGERYLERRQKTYLNNNETELDKAINNIFAINLLMPEDLFLDKYAEYRSLNYSHTKVTIELSKFFQVPYNKVLERYTYLDKQIPKKTKIYTFKKI